MGKFDKPNYKDLFRRKLEQPINIISSKDESLNTFFSSSSDQDFLLEKIESISRKDLKVDFSNFENFVFFSSAQSMFNNTKNKIIKQYPFDGSNVDIEKFKNSSTKYLRYLLDNDWPKYKGYLSIDSSISSSYVELVDLGKINNKAQISLLNIGTGSISVDFWIRPNIQAGTSSFISYYDDGTCGYKIYLESSSLYFTVKSGSISNSVSSSFSNNSSYFQYFCCDLNRNSATSSLSIFKGSESTFPELIDSSALSIYSNIDINPQNKFYLLSGSLPGHNTGIYNGDIDDFKVWKKHRDIVELSSSFNIKSYSQNDLVLNWRFNESGSCSDNFRNSIVLDSSGRKLHGTIKNYHSSLRVSGSALIYEDQDIDIYSDSNNVVSLVNKLDTSASLYDKNNNAIITNFVPERLLNIDSDEKSNILRNFLFSIAETFDELKLYINQFENIIDISYDDFDQVPDYVLNFLSELVGWKLTGNFLNTDAFSYLFGRNILKNVESNKDLDVKLFDIKNQFWRRVLNNLMYIYKTKGTKESIDALFRIYGVNDEFVKFKEHSYPTNIEIDTVNLKQTKAYHSLAFGSSSFTSSINIPILTNTHFSSSVTGSWTIESRVKMPVYGESFSGQKLSGSIWSKIDGSSYLGLKWNRQSLTSPTGSLYVFNQSSNIVSSSLFPLFDGRFYNIAVIRNHELSNLLIDVKTIDEAEIEYSGSWMYTGNTFDTSISKSYETFTIGYNASASLASEGYFNEFRVWSKKLNSVELLSHAMNFQSFGTNDPINDFENRLVGHWQLDENVSTSQSGTLNIRDYSVNRFCSGSGVGFDLNKNLYNVFTQEYNYISPSIDLTWTNDNIRVHNKSKLTYKDKYTVSRFATLEFNLVDSINEDIVKLFSSFDILNNYIGLPVNKYRDSYESLDKLRRSYFKRYTENVKFNEFFKLLDFLDASFVSLVQQLVPAHIVFKGAEKVVQSHLLERSKVVYPFRYKPGRFEPSGSIKLFTTSSFSSKAFTYSPKGFLDGGALSSKKNKRNKNLTLTITGSGNAFTIKDTNQSFIGGHPTNQDVQMLYRFDELASSTNNIYYNTTTGLGDGIYSGNVSNVTGSLDVRCNNRLRGKLFHSHSLQYLEGGCTLSQPSPDSVFSFNSIRNSNQISSSFTIETWYRNHSSSFHLDMNSENEQFENRVIFYLGRSGSYDDAMISLEIDPVSSGSIVFKRGIQKHDGNLANGFFTNTHVVSRTYPDVKLLDHTGSQIFLGDGQWHHIAVVNSSSDRGYIDIYADGMMQNHDTVDIELTSSYYKVPFTEFSFGQKRYYNSTLFSQGGVLKSYRSLNGAISDFRFSNTCLNSDDIKNSYVDGKRYFPYAASSSLTIDNPFSGIVDSSKLHARIKDIRVFVDFSKSGSISGKNNSFAVYLGRRDGGLSNNIFVPDGVVRHLLYGKIESINTPNSSTLLCYRGNQTNQFINGDFESGTVSWKDVGASSSFVNDYYSSTSGNRSLSIEQTSLSGTGYVTTNDDVLHNTKNNIITGYLKGNNSTPQIRNSNNDILYTGLPQNEWQSFSFVVAATPYRKLRLGYVSASIGEGAIFDNVYVSHDENDNAGTRIVTMFNDNSLNSSIELSNDMELNFELCTSSSIGYTENNSLATLTTGSIKTPQNIQVFGPEVDRYQKTLIDTFGKFTPWGTWELIVDNDWTVQSGSTDGGRVNGWYLEIDYDVNLFNKNDEKVEKFDSFGNVNRLIKNNVKLYDNVKVDFLGQRQIRKNLSKTSIRSLNSGTMLSYPIGPASPSTQLSGTLKTSYFNLFNSSSIIDHIDAKVELSASIDNGSLISFSHLEVSLKKLDNEGKFREGLLIPYGSMFRSGTLGNEIVYFEPSATGSYLFSNVLNPALVAPHFGDWASWPSDYYPISERMFSINWTTATSWGDHTLVGSISGDDYLVKHLKHQGLDDVFSGLNPFGRWEILVRNRNTSSIDNDTFMELNVKVDLDFYLKSNTLVDQISRQASDNSDDNLYSLNNLNFKNYFERKLLNDSLLNSPSWTNSYAGTNKAFVITMFSSSDDSVVSLGTYTSGTTFNSMSYYIQQSPYSSSVNEYFSSSYKYGKTKHGQQFSNYYNLTLARSGSSSRTFGITDNSSSLESMNSAIFTRITGTLLDSSSLSVDNRENMLNSYIRKSTRYISGLPNDALCYINFEKNVDITLTNGGVKQGVFFGNAKIADGQLVATYSDTSYAQYNSVNNCDFEQVGTVRFKYTPNYTGTPASVAMFKILGPNNNSSIYLRHVITTGVVRSIVYDNVGSSTTIDFNAWSPISGTEYEIECNYDFTAGSAKLFIDGVAAGTPSFASLTRSKSQITNFDVGYISGLVSNAKFGQFMVFNTVQHTSGYTPASSWLTDVASKTIGLQPYIPISSSSIITVEPQHLQKFDASESRKFFNDIMFPNANNKIVNTDQLKRSFERLTTVQKVKKFFEDK